MRNVAPIKLDNGRVLGQIYISDDEAYLLAPLSADTLRSSGQDLGGQSPSGGGVGGHHHGGSGAHAGGRHHGAERHGPPHDPAHPLTHPRVLERRRHEGRHEPHQETPHSPDDKFKEAAKPGEGAFDKKDDTAKTNEQEKQRAKDEKENERVQEGGAEAEKEAAKSPPETEHKPKETAASRLAKERAPHAATLRDPSNQERIGRLAKAEDPAGIQEQIEVAGNRARARPHRYGDGGDAFMRSMTDHGYYSASTRRRAARDEYTDADRKRTAQAVENYLSGGNLTNYGTGNEALGSRNISDRGELTRVVRSPGNVERYGVEPADIAFAHAERKADQGLPPGEITKLAEAGPPIAGQAAHRTRFTHPEAVTGPPLEGPVIGSGAPHNIYEGYRPLQPSELQSVDTPFGSFSVNPKAAADFKGFTEDLHKAGAPISTFGTYNVRPKAYGKGWSMHSYGIAFDIDNEVNLRPQVKRWIRENPSTWDSILRKHHMVQYMPGMDAPHVEWVGPRNGPGGAQISKKPTTREIPSSARVWKPTPDQPTKTVVLPRYDNYNTQSDAQGVIREEK